MHGPAAQVERNAEESFLIALQSAGAYLQTHWIGFAAAVLKGALVLFAALIAARVLARWTERALRRQKGRSETLAGVARSAIRIAVIGFGLAMALDQIGVNIGALLAGAGIVGLAVGFGAQSLVKDVISGFFLIFDGAIAEGDIVDAGNGVSGVVEAVGLRMTRIRAFNGQLWFVQNGEIRSVGNMSREWMRAIVEVGLAYEQDVAEGMRVLKQVADEWAEEHADVVIEAPEVQGLLGLNASDVGIRVVIKVVPPHSWTAERELRVRLKAAFDKAGVEIPFPRQVIYHRQEDEESALVVQTTNSQVAQPN